VSTSAAPAASRLEESIKPVVAARDLKLSVAAAPFAGPDRRMGDVVLTIGVEEPAGGPASAEASVLAAAFASGKPVIAQRQSVLVTRRTGASGPAQFEILSHLPLRPGRYEIRTGVEDAGSEKTGSVYTFVDVPDFTRAALSLSGALVAATPSPMLAAGTEPAIALPVSPTTRRAFVRSDSASVYFKIYQGGSGPTRPVSVTTRILDARNHTVSQRDGVADHPSADRSEDYRVELPCATLAAGQYLLRIEAKRGRDSASREVAFSVK
jgi:hypothetical protein